MFTTDGELANRLMHPSFEMDREYAVRVRGEVDDDMMQRLKAGVVLEDGPASFTDIQQAPGGEGFNHWYHCVVMEGRNREVRRLWESQGLVVSRLKRVRFGPVFLNSDLPMGRWREMSQYEVDILSAEVGLTPVAMPQMNAKTKDKLERMQRKSSRPLGKSERVRSCVRPRMPRRPSVHLASRSIEGERPRASRQRVRRASARPHVRVRPLAVVATAVAKTRGDSSRRPADKPAPSARPNRRRRVPASSWSMTKPSGKRRGAPSRFRSASGLWSWKPE